MKFRVGNFRLRGVSLAKLSFHMFTMFVKKIFTKSIIIGKLIKLSIYCGLVLGSINRRHILYNILCTFRVIDKIIFFLSILHSTVHHGQLIKAKTNNT